MKKKKLRNIKLNEVSIVDKGANRKTFAIIKRENEITELTIKTDGTFEGTALSVNGEEVEDLKSFWFMLWPPDDFDDGMVSGSYTVTETDGAEFDRESTFNLKKGMKTMELGKVLKSLGIAPDSVSEELTEGLESLLKYVDHMAPKDGEHVLNVVKAVLVKDEAPAEADDTPAESEHDPEETARIKAAMSVLNDALPEGERSVLKTEKPDKMDLILAAITDLKKGDGEEPEKDEDAAPGTAADILKRLVKVEKTTGVAEEQEDESAEEESDTPLTSEERVAKTGSKYPSLQKSWGLQLLTKP